MKLPRELYGVLPEDLAAAARWPLVKRFPLLVPFTRAALGGTATATENASAQLLLSCMGTTALVARYEGDFNNYDRIVPDKTDKQSDVIQELGVSHLAKLPLVVNALDRPRGIDTGMRMQCSDGIGLVRFDTESCDGTEWTVVIAPRVRR